MDKESRYAYLTKLLQEERYDEFLELSTNDVNVSHKANTLHLENQLERFEVAEENEDFAVMNMIINDLEKHGFVEESEDLLSNAPQVYFDWMTEKFKEQNEHFADLERENYKPLNA